MQNDKDQRTNKELEVEEYLSQFDSEEILQDDDNDITSFLLEDPDIADNTSNTARTTASSPDKSVVSASSSVNTETPLFFEDVTTTEIETNMEYESVASNDGETPTAMSDSPSHHGSDGSSNNIHGNGHSDHSEAIDLIVSEDGNADNKTLDFEDLSAGYTETTSLDSKEAKEGAAFVDAIMNSSDDAPAEGTESKPSSDVESEVSAEKKSFFDRFRKKKTEKPSFADAIVTEASEEAASPADQVAESTGTRRMSLESGDAPLSGNADVTTYGLDGHADAAGSSTILTEDSAEPTDKKSANKLTKAAAKEAKKDKKNKELNKALNKNRRRRVRDGLSFFVPNPDYDPSKGDIIVKNGKQHKNKPKKFSFFHFFRDCVLLGCLCVLIFVTYAFVVITRAPKIDPTNIYDNVQQSSVIYNDEGKAVDAAYYTQDRKIIKYEDMPENLVNAFVALEDKTFWKHHGFNWTRMIGAVLQSFTGSGKISGTSTITQQLARNVYLPETMSNRSIKRKVIEMYYAAIIERKLSKKEIIEAYLNSIYLGFGTYGVETASEAYFGKSAKKLSLVQCAALAALPQAPDTYALVQRLESGESPDEDDTVLKSSSGKYVANDASKDRRETCLALMKQQGYITEDEYNKAIKKKLTDFLDPELTNKSSVYAYFREYLIDQVVQDLMDKYDYSESKATDLVYTGGLKIYSTVDSKAQKTIVKEFNDDSNFPSIYTYNTDGNGNIVDSYGNVMLYKYSNFFNKKKEFVISKKGCTINDDGSLTIKSGYRLNIYTTSSGYSLEFKPTYVKDDGTLYMYSGGYINIPSTYETMDDDGNLTISAQFFEAYPGWIKLGKNTATITSDAYTMPEKTMQPQAAMVIVEVGTGKVKAMVGGRKQSGEHLYNRALNPRQSGSSIKPISVYAGALQKSYDLAAEGKKFTYTDTGHDKQGTKYYGDYLTASSVIIDEKMTFNGKTWPWNSSNTFSGAVTMRKALQQSINVCAVKLELQVGAEYIADLVEKFGITTLVRDGDTNDLNPAALALGGLTKGVIPLEMAQAYAAFPNGGVRQSSIAYTKVTDRHGNVILENKSESTKVLDEGVAFIMTDMLKSVVSQGIGYPAAISGVQSGGKTGTTSSEYDIWFDGFTPSYAAALWIGNDVNMQLTSMSGPAAALWGKIMNQIPKAKKGSYKSQPSDVTYVSGEYYTKGTESGRSTYYAEKAAEKKRKAEEAKKKAAEEAKKKAEEEAKNNQNTNDKTNDDDGDDD